MKLTILLAAVSILAGCVSETRVENLAISPDGKLVAYTFYDEEVVGVKMVFVWSAKGVQHVIWHPVDAPDEVQRLKTVDFSGTVLDLAWAPLFGLRGMRDDVRHVVFSPDSKRIAIGTERDFERPTEEEKKLNSQMGPLDGYVSQVRVVDVASGETTVLWEGFERIEWLDWVSADEVAYAVKPVYGDGDLLLCRQRTDAPAEQRTEILREENATAVDDYVFLSPDRHYAMVKAYRDKQPALVELRTGKLLRFGPGHFMRSSVAWKADGSLLVSFTHYVSDGPDRHEVFLLDPPTGGVTRLADELVNGRPGARQDKGWDDDLAWSADGEYLVSGGGKLIRPGTWDVVNLRRALDEAVLPGTSEPLDLGGLDPYPLPGWLRAGKWITGQGLTAYLVDYSVTHVVPLSEAPAWQPGPDGTWIVEVGKDGKAAVKVLELPQASPGSQE